MRATATATQSAEMPCLVIASGTREALKWLGAALMTLDHINKYLLHGSVPALFAAGRLALPIFSFVLACNLARPDSLERGAYARVGRRLAIAGTLASIPFIALGGLGWHWWPLNILFTLGVATAIMALVDRGGALHRLAAIVLFMLGGAIVEFWWPALVMTLAAWRYMRRPSVTSLVLWTAATASLFVINQNFWALAALPMTLLASEIDARVPRLKSAFYVFYPLHLVVLWALTRA